MAQMGLATFDATVNETNRWLKEIGEEMGRPDRQVAYHALRGVLFAVRDRLTVEEACDLAAQLPLLVRGIYFESYKPGDKPLKIRDRDEFVAYVRRELDTIEPTSPEQAIEAVFTVLGRNVGGGVMHHVVEMLPREVRQLLPAEALP